MIIPDTRFDLAALGIGPLAERVYLYLIDEGEGRSADAVAGRLGMDVPPVRIALEQLERRLLITRSAAPVPHYTARPPEPALESLVSRFGDELAQIRLYARDLQGRFREVGGRSGPSDMLEVVVGRREVLRHYAHLLESAKQEVSVFTKPPYVVPGSPQDVDKVLHTEGEGIRRGVRYRTVYDSAAVDVPFTLALARESMELGEEARLVDDLPMKLLLMDRSTGFIPLETDAPEAGSLIIRPSPLLDAMVALFEGVWARAMPLVPAQEPDGAGELDERARRVLLLMAAGFKDESIARALGTSRRTVQTHVSRIMAALGARTRFQTALLARERGWIGEDGTGAG